MNCLIMIMGSNKEPSSRNINAIKESYISFYNKHKNIFTHNYNFLIYRGSKNSRQLNQYDLDLIAPDDINCTFEKTLEAFQYANDNFEYDFIVRVNISTYINLIIIDKLLSLLKTDTIYCNAALTYINSIKYRNLVYPRGDAYIIHKNVVTDILNIFNSYKPINDDITGIEYVDDTMIGLLLLKHFNNKTHNHIQLLNYNFIPNQLLEINNDIINNSLFLPFSRLKTCPPNTYSGYSWDDNQYRLHDVYKFKLINNFIENNIQYILNISDLDYIFNNTRHCIVFKNEKYIDIPFNELIKILNEED